MQKRNLAHIACFLGGAAAGARLMYLLDPDRGRSRRARLRDRIRGGIHFLQRQANKQARNLGHHLVGGLHEIRSAIRDRATHIDEDILLDRVRAQLGRDVQHMRMLELSLKNGCVVVEGPVMHGEAGKIRKKLRKIRGVHDCDVRVEEIGHQEMQRISGQRGFVPERAAM